MTKPITEHRRAYKRQHELIRRARGQLEATGFASVRASSEEDARAVAAKLPGQHRITPVESVTAKSKGWRLTVVIEEETT